MVELFKGLVDGLILGIIDEEFIFEFEFGLGFKVDVEGGDGDGGVVIIGRFGVIVGVIIGFVDVVLLFRFFY